MKKFLLILSCVFIAGDAFAFSAYRSDCAGTFCNDEFKKMKGLAQIGADLAYETLAEYGKTAGQGVTVAVVDSGILLTHPEFSGKISGLQGSSYNGVALNPVWGDHGTHVAGISARRKTAAKCTESRMAPLFWDFPPSVAARSRASARTARGRLWQQVRSTT